MNIELKESLKIAVYYFFFGFLWILFSDKILGIFIKNTELYKLFQTYKGFFFIFLTSILLFNFIKKSYLKIETLNKELHNSRNLFIEKENALNDINKNINEFFNICLKTMNSVEYDDKLFIKDIFKISSKVAVESNFGSAFIAENEKIKFTDSIGIDPKDLKNINKDLNLYDFSSENIIINKNSSLKKAREYLYVGIYRGTKIVGGFNLYISQGSKESYSDESIRKIQVLQQLFNGFHKVKEKNDCNMMLKNNLIKSFIIALELHDKYTKGHSELVSLYCEKIGESLGLDEKELKDLKLSSVMHDIGKIIIPSKILNKKDRLSECEYEIIKNHSKFGYDIVSQNEPLKDISKYILHHHERWDGKGYPSRLKGNEIPLLSQIISVADAWHAMTSERTYKRKLTMEEGIEELRKNRGTQFSPEVVDIFLKILSDKELAS